jgi:hypothetical protein
MAARLTLVAQLVWVRGLVRQLLRAPPILAHALQGVGVVARDLPGVRASGPAKDVEGITFEEHLYPIAVDGDSVGT